MMEVGGRIQLKSTKLDPFWQKQGGWKMIFPRNPAGQLPDRPLFRVPPARPLIQPMEAEKLRPGAAEGGMGTIWYAQPEGH